jgi:hypothetical protein
MKKQTALSNERRVQQILVSGSAVLSQKNSAGVRIARKTKAIPQPPIVKGYPDLSNIPNDNYGNLTKAGLLNIDELDGGIISGQLVRAKYDNVELRKSIDTNIFELIPQSPIQLPDTVLRSVYNVVTQSVNNLTIEVAVLTTEVSTLNSDIQELEIVSESLKIEFDNERLKANIAQQQTTVANTQVGETTIDLSYAIQNSINEAIQRVSLTARNEALLQENESLREQLFGLSAQTAEGAISGGDNGFTVKVNNGDGDTEQLTSDLWSKTSHNAGGGRKMTNTLEVSNVTTDNKITSISFTFDGEPLWFKLKSGATSIEPETSETYECEFNNDVIGGSGTGPGKRGGISPKRRRIGWRGKGQNYKGLSLSVNVTFADGTTDSVKLTTNLRKNRG